MPDKQPEALRLADALAWWVNNTDMPAEKEASSAAAELRRLHEENEQLKTVPMKYRRMEFNAQLQEENSRLHALNAELLEALSDIAYGLESARIWGGMEWSYNSLRPFKYLPLRDKARAAIAKGEQP